MADVQQQFEIFHDTIRIDFDYSEVLREKRNIVVDNKIKKYLADNSLPTIDVLLQGSYKMKTGVKPIGELEHDIDIGLRFDLQETDYTAQEVRSWIWNAVKDHTKRIENKGPCIRVVYDAGFHLDLVTYIRWPQDSRFQYRLAHRDTGWRHADPPALLQYVSEYRERHFSDTEDSRSCTDQFRRCVRYLKRWGDVRIPTESDARPSGLALTLAAIQFGLMPEETWSGQPDDLKALRKLVQALTATTRIVVQKPTPEFEDTFSKLSDDQMKALLADLKTLDNSLGFASTTADPVAACKRLQEVFGPDFPVPDPKDSARKSSSPAIITSSRSAHT